MTKYEQKVRERAEEFHKIDPSIDIEFNGILDAFARLSLQREAEAYREAWEQCRENSALPPNDYGLSDKLQSLGLVPSVSKQYNQTAPGTDTGKK